MTVVPMPNTAAGLYPGIARAEYEAIRAVNGSTLVHFERSAMHAREVMLHPPRPTEAMELGTAIHCAVLEPSRFAAEYVAAPKVDRRTKDGKKEWADFETAHAGKTIISEDDFRTVTKMRDAAWSHPVAKLMLSGIGHNEVGVVWREPETGEVCKGLIDRVSNFDGWTWVLDVKSTLDASARAFSRQIKNLHYTPKASFYLDGCNRVAPRDRRFAWIAIEKTAPYAVAIYEPDGEAIDEGRSRYMRWLRNYVEARETNLWPGYPETVQGLGRVECMW